MLPKMHIALIVIIVGGMSLWYYVASQPTKYDKPETITNTVVEEVKVDVLEALVTEAIAASSTEIQEAAQAVFDAKVELMEKQIELEVRRTQREEVELKIIELEKQVGQYWTVKENLVRLVVETFPQDPHTAVAVASGESGLNPNAYNPEWHYDRNGDKLCQGSYGVMQIACIHHIEDPKALYDPVFNLKIAARVYADAKSRKINGWLPWGAYTDGGYKQYLAMR